MSEKERFQKDAKPTPPAEPARRAKPKD
jgi:hypothetical protein